MTTKHPEILPSQLAGPPDLEQAAARVSRAVAARDQATRTRRDAAAALEAAPAADKHALRVAVEQGKPDPTPSEPTRRVEDDAAKARLDAANELITEASAAYRIALVKHRAELDHAQAPRVAAAADVVTAALDALAAELDALAVEAGVWRGLHKVLARRELTPADHRSRMMGRAPAGDLPRFEPIRHAGAEHVAALRAIVEDAATQPTTTIDRRAEARRERQAKRERRAREQQEQEQRTERRRERSA